MYLSYRENLRNMAMSAENGRASTKLRPLLEEIEEMLGKAIARRDQWKKWFDQCSKDGDRDGMKEAARITKHWMESSKLYDGLW